MQNFFKPILMNENTDGNGGSAPQSEGAPEVVTPNPTSAQGEGDQFDDFGYKKEAQSSGEPKPAGEGSKKPEPTAPAESTKENATGYGDEPPTVTEPAPKAPAPPPDIDLGYELKADGLPADELHKLKEFLKGNEVPAKAAQAIADFRKSEFDQAAQAVESQKREVEKVKAGWHQELKADPTFGGEQFQRNVANVNKVVEDFMPNLKKVLTERKSMLPPYVMRDLAKLAEHLYSTPKLVQGEATKPNEEGDSKDSHAFLNEMYS